MEGDKERFLAAGMDDYVTKPLNKKALARVMEKAASPLFKTLETVRTPSRQSPEQSFDNLPPIDMKQTLANFENDEELLKECFEYFIKDSGKMIYKIRRLLVQDEEGELYQAAHALKGILGNFAVRKAQNMALILETQARKEDVEGAKKSFHDLRQEILKIISYMSAYSDWKSVLK